MLKQKPSAGFTLIELIIVAAITALLGTIMASVLLQTFRGESKVQVISKVKQNGQSVLENLVNDIRGGEKIICLGDFNTSTDSLVVYKAGVYYRYRFYRPSPIPGTLNQNGYIARDTFTADDFPSLSPAPTGSVPTPTGTIPNLIIGCQTNQFTDSSHGYIVFTDRDPTGGISIDGGLSTSDGDPNTVNSDQVFTLDKLAGYNDAVKISFKAYSGVTSGAGYDVTTGNSGILLSTTVELRTKR